MSNPFRSLPGFMLIAAAMIGAWAALAPAAAQEASEEDLARLQAEIARVQRELDRQLGQRDDGMAELRKVEESLAETRVRLASLAGEIATQAERRDRIEADRAAASARLGGEQAALGEQVRQSYMSGRQEVVRLLLSQENPADLGRMLVYYDYLNQHRSERIALVDSELARLGELAVESEAVSAELRRLEAAEVAEEQRLEREHGEREALIRELDAGIQSSEQQIERMRAEEAHLNEVIARLAELLESFPDSSDAPFADQRGKLSWPVDGRLLAGFGDARDASGRVRWNGALIEADSGSPVRAVYQGRVIHAQWTPGMGLLMILEHGDEYMTIYGHNAALLSEVGDWVAPGEAIAEVGNTGGQLGTALYFELRHAGEAIDPAAWIR